MSIRTVFRLFTRAFFAYMAGTGFAYVILLAAAGGSGRNFAERAWMIALPLAVVFMAAAEIVERRRSGP